MDHSFYWILLLCIAIGYAIGGTRCATDERIAITGNSLPGYENPPPPPEPPPWFWIQLPNHPDVYSSRTLYYVQIESLLKSAIAIWRVKHYNNSSPLKQKGFIKANVKDGKLIIEAPVPFKPLILSADRGSSNTEAIKKRIL